MRRPSGSLYGHIASVFGTKKNMLELFLFQWLKNICKYIFEITP